MEEVRGKIADDCLPSPASPPNADTDQANDHLTSNDKTTFLPTLHSMLTTCYSLEDFLSTSKNLNTLRDRDAIDFF